MKKEVGGSAGILALIALTVHNVVPHSESSIEPSNSAAAKAAKKDAGEKSGDEEVDGPWLATQAFFHNPASRVKQKPDDIRALVTCVTSASEDKCSDVHFDSVLGLPSPENRPAMFSIVATVADPSHSHMSLLLDGQAETIERAALQRGWDFSEEWLPWVDHFGGDASDINARRHQRWMQRQQEELPGVLVFRGTPTEKNSTDKSLPKSFPKSALFVFLVPERATGGIHGPAFFAAMHMASVLSSDTNGGFNKIGVLGPSFSGSLESLADLINRWFSLHPDSRPLADVNAVLASTKPNRPALNGTVYGTVANFKYANIFANETHLSFHSGVLDSQDYWKAFCEVATQYGLQDRMATLKEDEGGLQQSMTTSAQETSSTSAAPAGEHQSCQARTYFFPRDISHLRNAYRDTAGSAGKNPYQDESDHVNFSIHDPNSGEDSIPSFSEAQTPIVQDAILRSITDDLNRQHTRLVFISATNALDQLFLLQTVHKAVPNAKVAIEGAKILFIPAAAQQELDGTLFLSPYPMFFEGDKWLARKPAETSRNHIVFAESSLQGLYNVTQFLLEDMGAHTADMDLRGYSQPVQHWAHPGIWLLTLNHFGFLPLNLMGPSGDWSKISHDKKEEPWFRDDPEGGPAKLPPLERRPPTSWSITAYVISIAILSVCLVFIRCNISRSGARPLWFVLSDNALPRLNALAGACLSLAGLEWILALPWCIPFETFMRGEVWGLQLLKAFVAFGFIAPIVTLLFAVWQSRRRRILRLPESWGQRVQLALQYSIPLLLFGSTVSAWWNLCIKQESAYFFRFRALELYSGSSPALPLVIVCFTFFCVSLFHLKRYSLTGLARPRLDINPVVHTVFRKKFKDTYESIEQRIAAPWPVSDGIAHESDRGGNSEWISRLIVAAIFVVLCFLILFLSLKAFEQRSYNRILQTAVLVILLGMAATWYDLFAIWGCVKRLLNLIQILPLKPAFERVAKDWPKRPIWSFTRSVSNEAVQRAMLYILHRRSITLEQVEEKLAVPQARAAATGSGDGQTGSTAEARDPSDLKANQIEHTAAQKANKQYKDFANLVWAAPPRTQKTTFKKILMGDEDPPAVSTLEAVEQQQEKAAELAREIYEQDLIPAWTSSIDYEENSYLRDCADFVALQFCRFIAYTVDHLRRIAISLSIGFVFLVLLFNSYEPQGPELIGRLLMILFVAVGYVVFRVFAQMERDPILSTITHSAAGELTLDFWVHLVALGGLPLLGLIAHMLPAVSQFLFHWIAPGLESAH